MMDEKLIRLMVQVVNALDEISANTSEINKRIGEIGMVLEDRLSGPVERKSVGHNYND